MASNLYYSPFIPAFSGNGLPVAGAYLYFYHTGTDNLAPVYLNSSMTTPATNPVQADSAARFPNLYLDSSITYRIRVTDKEGTPLGNDVDPYIPGVALKGDPGGNVLSIGLFTETGMLSIPVGTDIVQTSGYSETGVGYATYFYNPEIDEEYVEENPYTSFLDFTGRGFELDLSVNEIDASTWGLIPQSTNTLDQTPILQDMIDKLSALAVSERKARKILLGRGKFNIQGLVLKSGVTIEGAAYRRQLWYDRGSLFRLPAGAEPGNMVSASGARNWALKGIEFDGYSATYTPSGGQGFRCIDYTACKEHMISACMFTQFGEQAIRSTGYNQLCTIECNLVYNCVLYRTRTDYVGAVELSETDGHIIGNETGCSATAEGADSAPLYNAQPYIAACWLKNTGGYLWVADNNWEISEIGLIDDSYQSNHCGNRYEFNKAWGLLSRGPGGQHYLSKFNGNSRTGNGLYAHARITALTNFGRPRDFYSASFDNTATAWTFTTTVLCEFEDLVYDLYGTDSDPTAYHLSYDRRVYPIRIKTNDPRIRINSVAPPLVFRGENGLRNSGLEGAVAGVIGSGGAYPTGWLASGGNGLTVEVVGRYFEGNVPYVRLKVTGTPSQTFFSVVMNNWDTYLPPATINETWTASAFIRLSDITVAPTSTTLGVLEIPAGGGNTIGASTTAPIIPWSRFRPLEQCPQKVTRTLTSSSAGRVTSLITFGLSTSVNYNFMVDIGLPQIERASIPGAPVITPLTRCIYPKKSDKQSLSNGSSYDVPVRVESLILTHPATISTLTVKMPVMSHDDVFSLSTVEEVTSLTLTPNSGQTFASTPPSTLSPNEVISYRYDASDGKLYPA